MEKRWITSIDANASAAPSHFTDARSIRPPEESHAISLNAALPATVCVGSLCGLLSPRYRPTRIGGSGKGPGVHIGSLSAPSPIAGPFRSSRG